MPSRFIKAKQGLSHSVIYTDETDQRFCFSGGTWTWRNHNPGNLRTGSVSRKFNQIGSAGGFAVFPDYETGLKALIYLLQQHYSNDSINRLARRYAHLMKTILLLMLDFFIKKPPSKEIKSSKTSRQLNLKNYGKL